MKQYFSLVKFSHTLFAMPFALIGFFLAYYEHNYLGFSWLLLGKVVLCMVFARNAAMAFNRYADRKIDAANERTRTRELPAGTIKASSALLFVVVNAALFCLTCALINPLTLLLSPVALLVVLGYSYTKRFTFLCHFVLGLGLAIAPTGAYIAVTGTLSVTPLLYSAAVLLWTAGFDIIYALQDEEFDSKLALHSIPAYFGRRAAMLLSSGLHIVVALLLCYVGFYKGFGLLYTIGTASFIALLAYQHLIISPTNLKRVNAAFFTTNGAASVLFSIFNILEFIFYVP